MATNIIARVGESVSPFPRPVFYSDPDGRHGLARYASGKWYARNHHRGFILEKRRSKHPRLVSLSGRVVIPVRVLPEHHEPEGDIF